MKAIYKIQNLITNDFYIGSAKNYTYRKWTHLKTLKENKHHNIILQNAWNKYGENNFSFTIIEKVDNDDKLIEREQFYIDTLNPKYNICKKAGSPIGIKHTYEARLHMSLAQKGRSLKDRGHKIDCKCPVCFHARGKDSPRFIKREVRICKCGCGKNFEGMITSKKVFINGHNKPQLGKKKSESHIKNHRESLLNHFKKLKSNG